MCPEGGPVSDAQLLLEGAEGAPEALVGVDQAAALLAVLARAPSRPREPAHQVRYAQRSRTAHPRPTVHQHPCTAKTLQSNDFDNHSINLYRTRLCITKDLMEVLPFIVLLCRENCKAPPWRICMPQKKLCWAACPLYSSIASRKLHA